MDSTESWVQTPKCVGMNILSSWVFRRGIPAFGKGKRNF